MRTKSMPVEEKRTIIDSMLKKLPGTVVSISLRHDASRVIQSIIQFGTIEQRGKVLQELAPKLAELAKTPYGHFTGLKAITTCTEANEQRKIIAGLKSHFVSLGTNVIGARLVESILQTYPHSMTRDLKAEFYGHVSIAFSCHCSQLILTTLLLLT
jgi:pumilio homology domain family member 6